MRSERARCFPSEQKIHLLQIKKFLMKKNLMERHPWIFVEIGGV
jgi:hypothetical protein